MLQSRSHKSLVTAPSQTRCILTAWPAHVLASARRIGKPPIGNLKHTRLRKRRVLSNPDTGACDSMMPSLKAREARHGTPLQAKPHTSPQSTFTKKAFLPRRADALAANTSYAQLSAHNSPETVPLRGVFPTLALLLTRRAPAQSQVLCLI